MQSNSVQVIIDDDVRTVCTSVLYVPYSKNTVDCDEQPADRLVAPLSLRNGEIKRKEAALIIAALEDSRPTHARDLSD